MKKKAAIELSANFLVVIILGIVIFGFGIYLGYRMMEQAEIMKANIDEDAQRQIWNLLDSGAPVVAPINTIVAVRGKYAAFGIGVRNVESSTVFRMEVTPKVVGECDATDAAAPANVKVIMNPDPQFIAVNDRGLFTFAVDVKKKAARPCEYVFYVRIEKCSQDMEELGDCAGSYEPYNLEQVITVSVP
jgi:hypothetical protein